MLEIKTERDRDREREGQKERERDKERGRETERERKNKHINFHTPFLILITLPKRVVCQYSSSSGCHYQWFEVESVVECIMSA